MSIAFGRLATVIAVCTVVIPGAAVAQPPATGATPPQPPVSGERQPGTYPLGPDSQPQPGVPKGKLTGPFEFKSKVLAGTVRRYWVYVPAQYTGDSPANVLVFQDGQRATNPTGVLQVPQVLENLIHKKEIPITIGIFITPGHRAETYPDDLGTGNPNNRAAEYRLAERCVQPLPDRRDAAGGGEDLQAHDRPGRPGDWRHEQRRHLRVHRRLASA